MAKFLIFIYGDEQVWENAPDEWHRENGERHRAFVAEVGAGLIDGGELYLSDTATSLRPDGSGTPIASDGPFIETKEAIGGFYLLEAADEAEAIRLARMLPEASAPTSGVEVRRVGHAD